MKMKKFNLPSDLETFLKKGKQLEYNPDEFEFGKVELKEFSDLELGAVWVNLAQSPLIENDPHAEEEGYYEVPAVSLIYDCEYCDYNDHYFEFILLWLTNEKLFGSWDNHNWNLYVFPNATWNDIVKNPIPFLNVRLESDSSVAEFFRPWPTYEFNQGIPKEIKSSFVKEYWTENRHDLLLSLPKNVAKKFLESLDKNDVYGTVNIRRFQESYICDYLIDLWDISQESFWQQIRISLRHPHGIPIGESDYHFEIMLKEELPDYVWIALLEALLFVDRDMLNQEMGMLEIIRTHTTTIADKEHKRILLISWLNEIDKSNKEHIDELLDEINDQFGGDLEQLDDFKKRDHRNYIVELLKEAFNGEVPSWLKEGIR